MKLLTELKERREKITVAIEEKRQSRKAIQSEINSLWSEADELDVAVAAIEASNAAANEEQPDTWQATRTDAEITVADLDKLATKASVEERAEMVGATTGPWEPEIPEGFTKHDGGEWMGNPRDAVQIVFESGIISDISHTVEDEARFWHWPWDGKSDRIIAFQIVGPAPIISEPSADGEEALKADPLPGFDEADAESDAEGKPEELEQNEEDKENERLRVAWRAQIDAEIVAANQRMSETLTSLTSGEGAAEIIRILTGDAEPTSILNDPELQAAVNRANASIAQDERKRFRVYVETSHTGGGTYFDTLAEARVYADEAITTKGVLVVRVQECSHEGASAVDLFVWPQDPDPQSEPRVEGDPALMFGHGMVADAERHQREPSLAERLTGMFKREKEDA